MCFRDDEHLLSHDARPIVTYRSPGVEDET